MASLFDGIKARLTLATVYRDTLAATKSKAVLLPGGVTSVLPPDDYNLQRQGSANPNPLRLPCFRGPYATSVYVLEGQPLDDIIARSVSAPGPPPPAAAPDGEGSMTPSRAVGGAGGPDTPRRTPRVDGSVEVVADAGFGELGGLVRGSDSSAVYGPVLVCGVDGDDFGGGAGLGASTSEAELHRRTTSFTLLKTAHDNSVTALKRVKPWQVAKPTVYPIPEAGGLYLPSITLFRRGPDAAYAFLHSFSQVAVILSPIPKSLGFQPSPSTPGRMRFDPESRVSVLRACWNQLRMARDHHHAILVIAPFILDVEARTPPDHLAELYLQLLTEFFVGVFEEVRFVIPPTLPHALAAFQHTFGVQRSGLAVLAASVAPSAPTAPVAAPAPAPPVASRDRMPSL